MSMLITAHFFILNAHPLLRFLQTFDALNSWVADFIKVLTPSDSAVHPGLVLVGTKMDLEANRQVTQERALQWCDQMRKNVFGGSLKVPYFETSSRVVAEGAVVEDVLGKCVRVAEDRDLVLARRNHGDGGELGDDGAEFENFEEDSSILSRAGIMKATGGSKQGSAWAMCAGTQRHDRGASATRRGGGGGDNGGDKKCAVQ